MADYKTYLATNILTEDKTVSYRLLSRALKVHVNTAKEMLYDFHRSQNAKKPDTLHATYLLAGIKPFTPTPAASPRPANGSKQDGEDEYMQSSPFMASSMPQVEEDENAGATCVLSITLVREEDLEELKAQYTQISSIHIYSLGPSRPQDLQMLSDVTRQLRVLTSVDDPLTTNSIYGTISNPLVKRRINRRPPPPAAAVVAPKPAASKSATVKSEPPKLTRQDSSKTSQPSSAKDFFAKGKEKAKAGAHAVPPGNIGTAPSSKESTPAPPANLKREGSSIFKAFAKTKEPKNKVAKGTKKEEVEDVAMSDDGEDDGEDEILSAPPKRKDEKEETGETRNMRKEREEKLRKMMEESDDDESAQDSKEASPAVVEDRDVEMEDGPEEEEDVEPKKAIKNEPVEESEPTITVSNGRRRGKRRVMKKKTVQDEEGYLVTREEAAWESFSEDEPAPKAKPKPVVAVSGAKGKKPVAKAGQGNIMSFFGKK